MNQIKMQVPLTNILFTELTNGGWMAEADGAWYDPDAEHKGIGSTKRKAFADLMESLHFTPFNDDPHADVTYDLGEEESEINDAIFRAMRRLSSSDDSNEIRDSLHLCYAGASGGSNPQEAEQIEYELELKVAIRTMNLIGLDVACDNSAETDEWTDKMRTYVHHVVYIDFLEKESIAHNPKPKELGEIIGKCFTQ